MKDKEEARAAGIVRNTDDPALIKKKLKDRRMALYRRARPIILDAIDECHAHQKKQEPDKQ